ncbi:DUF2652 domain-containing protein [Cytophaga sp. FL35]|uniref:DUF2652 domain-containing protein n=1 Tax=Cytophaga sp. FL35 TaxID=1904456 RepID=UPI001653DA72|nr:DUF2652 domain-containing protein [Cytophaga sp. FL35]MBC7000730.1 DUF2652 domain-containing protein [Cytophaga sp. FL35]
MKPFPTLICIPDISGFTEFMSKVDFDLGSRVIPSLLNKIIYSNQIGLKISEIEGDAVLFYKQGKLPSLERLIDQCKSFYNEFYRHIEELLEKERVSENVTQIPKILGLKIILHFGEEIAHVTVGKHIKLMGEDIIAAHRLLKNDVPLNEYILISDKLLDQYDGNIDEKVGWTQSVRGSVTSEHIGKVGFSYVPLSPLLPS